YESIFAAPTESEDLFGDQPSAGVELPSVAALPPLLPDSTDVLPPMPDLQPQPVALTVSPPALEGTQTYLPVGVSRPPPALESSATPEPAAPPTATPPSAPLFAEQPGEGGEDLASLFRGGPVRTSRGGGWFIALFIMPLISYSVLATIVAG